MAYGFNDDKSKVEVPTKSEFDELSSGTLKMQRKLITVPNVRGNQWTSYTVEGIPSGAKAVIPVLVEGYDPNNQSTIWANGLSVYVEEPYVSQQTDRTIIIASTRSSAVTVKIRLYILY
ncbi:MAG: hypothetical protein K5660_00285 [Paludibacteraceae bacterium]|nr:hypothetical protein [Paludibacteraceae bacterium]